MRDKYGPPGGSFYGAFVWLFTTAISLVVIAWCILKLAGQI